MFWRMLLHRTIGHDDLEAIDLNYSRREEDTRINIRQETTKYLQDVAESSCLNGVFPLFSIRAMGNLKRTSNASDFFEGVSLGGGAVHLFPGGRSGAQFNWKKIITNIITKKLHIKKLQ